MEEEIGRVGIGVAARTQAASGRERPPEAVGCGSFARAAHAPGGAHKKVVAPRRRRELVRWAQQAYGMSERRASRRMAIGRSTVRYQSRADDQEALRQRLRELAAARVRFGYRRLTVLLKREGWNVNAKRIYRLYKEEGLIVRTQKRKKAASRACPTRRGDSAESALVNGFVSDRLADGRWFRILTVVDQFTRECIVLLADRSMSGEKVSRALEQAIIARGAPESITVYNGSEFASKAFDAWPTRMAFSCSSYGEENRSRTPSPKALMGGYATRA